MKRTVLLLSACALAAAACNKDDAKPAAAPAKPAETKAAAPSAPLRNNINPAEVPLPPSLAKAPEAVTAAAAASASPAAVPSPVSHEVYQGPTKGEESPGALAKAFVEAAKKRDLKAFQDLTVCGRDIGLFFHPGVQVAMRQGVAFLSRKFISYTQQIPADGELIDFKKGLAVDFQKGQGATTPMPGLLASNLVVKSGDTPKTLPLGRLVQIEGRWKILDF